MSNWINAKDKLPECDIAVLAFWETKSHNHEPSDAEVSYYTGSGWQDSKGVTCRHGLRYVTHWMPLPEPPTKPSIDWTQVHPNFKYLARDKCGSAFLYEEEPYARFDDWTSGGGYRISAITFLSLQTGNCDWTESLVERPKE